LANGLNPEPDAALGSIFTGLRLFTSNESDVGMTGVLERITLVATLFAGLAGDCAAAETAGAAADDGTPACVPVDADEGGATDWPLQPTERAQQETTRARRWVRMTYSVVGRKRAKAGRALKRVNAPRGGSGQGHGLNLPKAYKKYQKFRQMMHCIASDLAIPSSVGTMADVDQLVDRASKPVVKDNSDDCKIRDRAR
jgi:hypothetical protein